MLDFIIQCTQRRLAIQLSLASTFDACARLTSFKQHQHASYFSLDHIQDD
jgi:hypothetical protein